MKTREIFHSTVQRFRQAGIPEPELEASLLLARVLDVSRTSLLLSGERLLDGVLLEKFEKDVARRLHREPLAYIHAEKEFWSLPFKVNSDVLIPRPETEQLIELAITTMAREEKDAGRRPLDILDLGTGSGIIAVVLALELRGARITAVDLSFAALRVAAFNAKRHNVERRINLVNSNWLQGISLKNRHDLVLANPPYVAGNMLEEAPGGCGGTLAPEVVRFEPRLALDGGERGLEAIRMIAGDLGGTLKEGGWFFMEIGSDQAEDVTDIFQRTAAYDTIVVHNDLAGLPRIFQARRV